MVRMSLGNETLLRGNLTSSFGENEMYDLVARRPLELRRIFCTHPNKRAYRFLGNAAVG